MTLLADILGGVFHGALLVSLALVLGGVAWSFWGLRPWQGRMPRTAVARSVILLQTGAFALALCQAALLALTAGALSDALGSGRIGDFFLTAHFAAGATRTALALGVGVAAWWLGREPLSSARWITLSALALVLAVSGGWLTHASSRVEGAAPLMALTVLHQVGALVWAGALFHLAATWRLTRRDPDVQSAWPGLVSRFSTLALASMLLLILPALPLAWTYAGSLGSLVGTAYGSLILLKSLLLGAALVLAAFNFAAARRRDAVSSSSPLRTRVPYLVEGEVILAVMIVFTAAALSDQPPSTDIRTADQATVREVGEVFRPKLPSLRSPSLEEMRQERARPAGEARTVTAYRWSNFSHNVAGLILLFMAGVALAGALRQATWERYWPLGFVAMAAFIYLRAAANDGVWPFGSATRSPLDAEGLQHFLAAFLVLGLGVFEWRARSTGAGQRPWRWVFPALAMAGGVLLLTHSHTAFEAKPSFLVQVTHTTIGALAGLIAASRWLELRLPPPGGRLAGAVAAGAMLAIALVLVFYREANVALPE